MSSPCSSPLTSHRQHPQNGHIQRHCHKDGYSSLERLNRRPRVNKCSLEKLFLQRTSLETIATTLGHDDRLCSGGSCSRGGSSSSDEGEGEAALDNPEFVRNRKERSTVLVRRFFRNNQKVCKGKIPFLETISVVFFTDRINENC